MEAHAWTVLDADAEFGGGDAAAMDALPCDGRTDGEGLECARDGLTIGPGVGKRANQHIPRDAGERIDIANGHSYSSV